MGCRTLHLDACAFSTHTHTCINLFCGHSLFNDMRRTRKLIPDFSVAGLAVVSEVTQVVLQNHMS